MPTISKDIWITREGEQIEIKLMASGHLLSTIHFIERNRLQNAMEVWSDTKLGDERLNAVDYYLQFPIQYESLIDEAVRRHLISRPTIQGIVIRGPEVKKLKEGKK